MWMSISDILFTFFWILCFQLFLQYVNFLCLSSAFYPHSPYVFVSPGNLINVFSTLLSRSLIKVADRSQRKHHRNPLNMSFQAHGESVILTLTDLLAIPLKYFFQMTTLGETRGLWLPQGSLLLSLLFGWDVVGATHSCLLQERQPAHSYACDKIMPLQLHSRKKNIFNTFLLTIDVACYVFFLFSKHFQMTVLSSIFWIVNVIFCSWASAYLVSSPD